MMSQLVYNGQMCVTEKKTIKTLTSQKIKIKNLFKNDIYNIKMIYIINSQHKIINARKSRYEAMKLKCASVLGVCRNMIY